MELLLLLFLLKCLWKIRIKLGMPEVLYEVLCLSLSGLLQQNTIGWVTYKQWAFISHGFEGWEIQLQGTGRFGV